MLRRSCVGGGELPQSKRDKYDSPEMERSLECLRTRKPAWVGGGAGRSEVELSCHTDGLWAMVRTTDFILKAAFGWEVVCFKNTTLRGEQPEAWKQGQQSRGHHRGAEEDGGGLVQSVSGKGGGKGMELGYVLQAEEM